MGIEDEDLQQLRDATDRKFSKKLDELIPELVEEYCCDKRDGTTKKKIRFAAFYRLYRAPVGERICN